MRDLQAIMEMVQNLLNRAEHPNTPEAEAESCRAKVQELMQKYRLAEEDLIAADPQALAPVLDFVTVCGDTKWASHYSWLLSVIADHCGTRIYAKWEYGPDGYSVKAGVVGYESDIRLMSMIYGAARLAFQSFLEPTVDSSLSDEENIYRLRSSGLTRRKVANLLWGLDTHASHAKVGTVYKEECRKRGEQPALDGKGIDLKTYQESYARSFINRIGARLRRSRDAADATGGAITLHGRKERVEEAFYGFFPDMRPKPATQERSTSSKPRKTTKAEARRIQRRYYSAAAHAGEGAGGRAADTVELDRAPMGARIEEGLPAEKGQIGQA